MRRRTIPAIGVVAVLGFGLVGCGSDGGSGGDTAAPGHVKVTLKDFKIALASSSVRAGKVTFDVTNGGPSQHEFVVFKTDLDPAKLPTKADGDVDEGKGIDHIDEIEDIGKGDTPSLAVDLGAGHYVVVCNLPAHYRQGMRAEITVT